jgi:indoleamine 2,3-dioxygenase
MVRTSQEALETYGITERRGFLPNEDPLVRFDVDSHGPERGAYLAELDRLGERLPELLAAGESRPELDRLDTPPDGLFDALSERELVRVCLLTGFFASGYANEIGSEPVDSLPAGVAVPLYRTSQRLGRKPILSYDLISLRNFERVDPDAGMALETLETLQQFTSLPDERWFTIVHVAIEAAAGPGLAAAARGQAAIRRDDSDRLREHLDTLTASIERQTDIMSRMLEGNDPEVFATEFRPYYEGFDDVVFEGVDALAGESQTLRGGSGAQSCVLPSLDSALGIEHQSTVLLEKLLDMRTYMPEDHRAVIDAFEDDVDIRPYVHEQSNPELTAAFNQCIDQLRTFRKVHFGQVIQYIRAQTGDTTGTGGTDYMDFLGQMEEETSEHKV